MRIVDSILMELDQEGKTTRRVLERVPGDKLAWQPHPKSMNLGRLAGHVAELPSWTTFTLDREVLEIGSDFKPDVIATRAELLSKFDQHVADARKAIAAASDADWAVIWTFKWDGKEIMSMPRSAVMRGTIMNHMIHHRAQLGVFLRLNDVAIPGMYGPSADEMKFWEAAK